MKHPAWLAGCFFYLINSYFLILAFGINSVLLLSFCTNNPFLVFIISRYFVNDPLVLMRMFVYVDLSASLLSFLSVATYNDVVIIIKKFTIASVVKK